MGRVNVRGENTQFLQFKNYEKSPLCVCVCVCMHVKALISKVPMSIKVQLMNPFLLQRYFVNESLSVCIIQ